MQRAGDQHSIEMGDFIMRYVNGIVALCVLFFFIPIAALAGSLDDLGPPDNIASAMYTLEDIYNRLNAGTAGTKRTGAFTEPSSGPGSTGHTTDDIMGKAPSVDNTNGAGVADVTTGKKFWGLKSGEWGTRTGTRYGGCVCSGTLSGTRWCDNGDGTVTDLNTCLVWLKNASWGASYDLWEGTVAETSAHDRAAQLENGVGGLIDGSVIGDWRLPTKTEIYGLANGTEAVRSGNMGAFDGVMSGNYWSSTTNEISSTNAWAVGLSDGALVVIGKQVASAVWPVRSGN
jgi:hypothetical protein